MANDSRNLRVDRDGVRVYHTATPKRFDMGLLVGVLGLVAVVAIIYLLWPGGGSATQTASRATEPEPQVEAVAAPDPEVHTQTPGRPTARNLHAVHVDRGAPAAHEDAALTDEQAEQKKDQPEIDARDVILALQASGEKEGIAAFNPPGTNPPKSGIIVPDDFQVPDGYVKHYQTTDDGEQLAPILMFSPDYQFVDANGNPITLPDDLIVPPDMAPPGLPIKILDVPKRRLH